MPRVLHAATSMTVNGVVRSVLTLARRQRECGWDPVVLTTRHGRLSEACEKWSIPVLVDTDLHLAEKKDVSRQHALADAAVQAHPRVAALRPDLIHAHLPSAGLGIASLLARRLDVPLVQTQHVVKLAPYDRDLMTGTDLHVITVAGAARDLLVREGVPPERVVHIPNGVPDPADCEPGHLLPRDGRRHLVYAARLAEPKGLDTAIAAMELLRERSGPDCPVLHVFGDGPQSAEYRALVTDRRLDDVVVFHGEVLDVIHPRLGAAALIAPSKPRSEACPLTVLEAMASRIPVITTTVEGVTELITDQVDGLLVAPGAPRELAEAVAYLLGNKDVADRCADAARRKFEQRYTMEPMTRATLAFYRQALGRAGHGGASHA
ncbi:glycosyltransferase family 4 protein [Streptomyces sp. NPDC088400]|uniref:glycosyltransferase family 4 protein n=1 Tax=Streptomyces sp. NPDC088400 TaxID=3365861 RepID=UPI0038198CC5